MSKLIALLQFLFALAGYPLGGTVYSDHVGERGHETLISEVHTNAASARFQCQTSASGWCHYTLCAAGCQPTAACAQAPLRRFAVARGDSRQIAGLDAFRLCVTTDAAPLGPDCRSRVGAPSHG